MEQGRLREKYRDNQAWSSAENERIARQRMVVFQCPSIFTPTDASQRFYTSFVAVTGSRTTFSDSGRRNFPENITDGADETLMLLEASGQQIVWTEPRDADVDAMPLGLNLDGREIGRSPGIGSSYHPGGVNAVFAGGNSQFLSEDIDPEVLRALLTIDGAEAVDDF
jgi:prepilin-type processing-associated H-X9-DG protein